MGVKGVSCYKPSWKNYFHGCVARGVLFLASNALAVLVPAWGSHHKIRSFSGGYQIPGITLPPQLHLEVSSCYAGDSTLAGPLRCEISSFKLCLHAWLLINKKGRRAARP
jgi:hypothetical protein